MWLFLAAALTLAGALAGLIVFLVARRAGEQWSAALVFFGLSGSPDPDRSAGDLS